MELMGSRLALTTSDCYATGIPCNLFERIASVGRVTLFIGASIDLTRARGRYVRFPGAK